MSETIALTIITVAIFAVYVVTDNQIVKLRRRIAALEQAPATRQNTCPQCGGPTTYTQLMAGQCVKCSIKG